MRKIHEVLRLKWTAELTNREIAKATGIARSTVSDYLRRAEEAGLSWPLPDELDHERLSMLLFKKAPEPKKARPLPIWADVHRELRRKGMTLWLLWEEYCAGYAGSGAGCYSYTRFCELYRAWNGTLDVWDAHNKWLYISSKLIGHFSGDERLETTLFGHVDDLQPHG